MHSDCPPQMAGIRLSAVTVGGLSGDPWSAVRAIHTPVLSQGFYLPLLSQITVPRSSVGKRCLGGWVRDHGRAALTLVASDRRVGNHHIADGYRDLDLVDAAGL